MIVWALIITELYQFDPMKAILTAVMLTAYLRISEALEIRGEDVVDPAETAAGKSFALIVAPKARGLPSKNGEFDQSILIGSETFPWMPSVMKELKRRRPVGRWFEMTYEEYKRTFDQVTKSLGLPYVVVPHQARHSGPSWHRLQATFTLEEVRKRGRWRSMRSVLRYEKAGLLLKAEAILSAEQKSRGLDCMARLGKLLSSF